MSPDTKPTDRHFPVRLTLAQRIAVAEVFPTLSDRLRLDETNHLHKERDEHYSFASYVLRENRKGEEVLVCYQMNKDRIISMIDRFLRDLTQTYYVSIVDYDNYGVYLDPVNRSVRYYNEKRFGTTFYKWILQVVPRNYTEIEREVTNRRR